VLHKPIYQQMADDVARATGGAVKIRIFPSGELGQGREEQYNRAARHIADITDGAMGDTSSLFPKTLLIELPGIATGPTDATRKLWAAMDRHLADEFKGTKVLAAFTTSPSVFMTTGAPIRSPEDLKGLKMRTPSRLGSEILKAYGAHPVQMPAPKVYTAMSTGVIDGALMSVDTLVIFKLLEPVKYVSIGAPAMVTALYIVMNEAAWSELSPSQRTALDQSTGAPLSLKAAGVFEDFGEMALKQFGSVEGKVVHQISPENAAKFERLAAVEREKIVRSFEARGVPAGKVLDAMR
jgi:TRAP-type C4-dicarboxylate transport system substrate-binding protein